MTSPSPADKPVDQKRPPASFLQAPRHMAELFWVFNHLTLLGVGGVLPFAQRILVEDKRWLSNEEFVEMLSLGQVLPGPNLINLALMVGQHFFGWRGAVVALAGMLAAPLVLIFVVAIAYAQYASTPAVARALQGMSAVVAGLVIAMAIKLFPAIRHDPSNWGWMGLAFVGVGLLHIDLLWVLIALGPIAVAWAWWRIRRA
ncbi:MAG: chromate transporter [Thiomonas sp.]|uniref:chromate transporter n=1 Tax=Thiomonas sp. TaxID=2047785 RepID=UPI002A36E409|nr:chromate transporter [Thiomonas sp.]MDY0329719.1 chromate transporter [Thiomonas sp.]